MGTEPKGRSYGAQAGGGANTARGLLERALGQMRQPVATYTAAVVVAQSINMIVGLLVMRWLAPAELGVWQAMLTLETYCLALRLGVINGMNRQLPFLLGRGDRFAAQSHAETTLGFTLGIAALLFVVFVASAQWWPGLDAIWQLSLLTLACYTPCGLYSAFNEATYRGSRTFNRLGWLLIATSVVGAALLILLPFWGYAGQCLRLALIALVHAVSTALLRPMDVRPRFSISILRELLKVGIPLYLQNYLTRASVGVGALVLLWLGGPVALGYFAPAGAMLAVVGMLPSALQSYLQPQLHYEFGRDGSRPAVVAKARRNATFMMLGVLPLALVGVLLLPWAVPRLLPAYEPSITAMQVAILVGTLRVFGVAASVLSTLAAWRELLGNQAAMAALHVIGALGGGAMFPERSWFGITVGLLTAALAYIPLTLWSLARATREPI